MKKHKINIKEVLAQDDGSNQANHLRYQIKTLNHHIKTLRTELGSREEFIRAAAGAVVAAEPFKPFRFTVARRDNAAEVVAAIKLSDWHIGEVVQPGEVEGLNEFNWAIAQERMHAIVNDFLKWIEVQRTAYRIDEVAVLAEGDYVSGDIHPELLATNEFPLPVQAANAGRLLGETVRRLAAHFKRVNVYFIGADNHGRLTRKPQAKQKSTNNASYMVWAILDRDVAHTKNVKVVRAEGMKMNVDINGFKFLIEHGDTVRGVLGIPYYGFGRATGREAKRRMNTDLGFHYWSIGHFHVPAIIEGNILVNGSLSGTTEFDHSAGRHAEPSQVAFLVSKHGIFNWVPFSGDSK
jgi:hypothetical protein